MGNHEVATKVKELKELKELTRMQEELTDAITALQDAIKAEMTARAVDDMTAGEYRIRWTPYTTNRIDTAALKKAMPELAERFTKSTEARRFVVQQRPGTPSTVTEPTTYYDNAGGLQGKYSAPDASRQSLLSRERDGQ